MFRCIWPLLFATAAISAQPRNPPRLSYATYVGDAKGAVLYGLAVDSAGYAYVSGSYAGCAFLTKLNQTATAAIWSVCLPMVQVNAVKVDAAGYIFVAGSNEAQPFRSTLLQISTIMKLSPDAKQTVYATPITGAYSEDIVLDAAGDLYLVGLADNTFRPTPGAYLPVGGRSFAAKLNPFGGD